MFSHFALRIWSNKNLFLLLVDENLSSPNVHLNKLLKRIFWWKSCDLLKTNSTKCCKVEISGRDIFCSTFDVVKNNIPF